LRISLAYIPLALIDEVIFAMSDAIEKTAAGATRGLFGALGFILLIWALR
jgi:hypothetical protein